MAPKLIYCGSDNSHRLSVLRSAGYTVENCGSASDLGSFLAPGAEILVILFSDEEKETLPEMIDTARACCSAPLAVFRHSSNIQDDIGYDLFLGVPVHVAPAVVLQSGMCQDGWIPVDARTLESRFPGVYAVGDVTSVGTPKAGVFAEGQARVVASAIIANMSNQRGSTEYDGRGQCYLEFGRDQVARVDVTFTPGAAPAGTFESPSKDLAEQKAEFGSSRVRRWFDRDWSTF